MRKPLLFLLVSLFALSVFYIGGYRVDGNLGALTDITQSTRITDFVDIYNTNNLQTIQVGTTSVDSITTLPNLSSIGTLTTAVWNGTPIGQTYSGTGSTTALTGILWGDFNGSLLSIATGTQGQILTSNGYGAMPSFQDSSVNLAQDYTWTGHHNFSSLFSTLASSTDATTTNLSINGLSYSWPGGYGASSTALVTDGLGNLVWGDPGLILATTTENDMVYATITIPALSNFRLEIDSAITSSVSDTFGLYMLDAAGALGKKHGWRRVISATNQGDTVVDTNGGVKSIFLGFATTSPSYVTIDVFNDPSKAKEIRSHFSAHNASSNDGPGISDVNATFNETSAAVTTLVFWADPGGEGASNGVLNSGMRVRVYRK